jgi:hypothetical protein
MAILHLNPNDPNTELLKSQMTDSMWRKVRVTYTQLPLHLEIDNRQITDLKDIVAYLQDDPTTTHKLQNARKAAANAFEQLKKTGNIKVSKQQIEVRRDICNNCPFKVRKWLGDTCSKCGCNIKSKTLLLSEVCPLGKW